MPADSLTIPEEWKPGLDALRELPDGAAALLIGATDRGKTTFTAMAAQALAAEMGRTAVVDADIGQSEIGPPGTVGVARADAKAQKLTELKPGALFFVGSFAAHAAALEHAAAVGQAVAYAREQGARRILVDTTGFVSGPAARRLKVAKAQIVRPALILGIAAKDGEIDALLAAVAAATGAPLVTLPVPAAVGRKSTSVRATRRLARLSQALDGAREIPVPLASLVTVGATLGTGEPVAPHLVRWAGNALRLPVHYAESGDGVLSVFLRSPLPRGDWEAGAADYGGAIIAPVAEHFGARTVRAFSLAHYADVYLGLHDATGRLLSVGRFLRLDAERGEVIVSAPPPATAERVRLVAFGRVRVREDGSAGGDVKPGEI